MSKVALIKCNEYDFVKVKESIKKGIKLLGGLDNFVKPGEKILLKPNMLAGDSPEKCTTTHPAVFRAVAEILLENKIKVSFGDSPGFGSPLNSSKKTGIFEEAEKLGIQLSDFESGKEKIYEHGRQNKKFIIANGVLESDGVISLPKFKTHGFQKITGAVKNQFGCIPGLRKGEFHVRTPDALDFAKMLVDLNNFIKPRLYIMDGIIAMEGNGPRGGTPKKMSCIIISNDPVALDATMCRLIDLRPEIVPTIAFGYETDAGTYLEEEIEILGDNLIPMIDPTFIVDRKEIKPFNKTKAFNFLSNALVSKPVIDRHKCIRCGECILVCPVNPKALSWSSNKTNPPVYDYSKCIRCYCCQELCPKKAIHLKKPFLRRIILK